MNDPAAKYHAYAHSLNDRLLLVILNFRNEVSDLPMNAVVHGVEMTASLMRRVAKDKGATKDEINELRWAASKCAGNLFATYDKAPNVTAEQEKEAAAMTKNILDKLRSEGGKDA